MLCVCNIGGLIASMRQPPISPKFTNRKNTCFPVIILCLVDSSGLKDRMGQFIILKVQKNLSGLNTDSSFTTRSGNILSFLLPLFQEGQLSVTGESMCTKYWLTA